MEDYGWLIFVAIFWVLSSIGEFRKKGKARQREGEQPPKRGSTRPDPAASGRDLAADVDAAARQAEDALRRWEARQREIGAAPAASGGEAKGVLVGRAGPGAVSGDGPRGRPQPPAVARRALAQRRRELVRKRAGEDERRSAYEAIAGMLSGEPVQPAAPAEPEPSATWAAGIAREADIEHVARLRPRDVARPIEIALPASRDSNGGLERLDRLPAMQHAIVLSEILGPPKALG